MTAEFEIRVAVPADADSVGSLLEASYTALFAGHYDSAVLAEALPLMTRAHPGLLASGTYYVVTAGGGGPVGCGGWSVERPGSGETAPGLGHVRHFAVHPDWIRRGVGSALLARCVAEAAARDIVRFECNSSLAAVTFYRALGFAIIRPVEVELAPGVMFAGVLMEKQLPNL